MWGDGCSNDLSLLKKKESVKLQAQFSAGTTRWTDLQCDCTASCPWLELTQSCVRTPPWGHAARAGWAEEQHSRGERAAALAGKHGHSRRCCAACFSGWLLLHFLWKWQTRACKSLWFLLLLSVAKVLSFPEFYFNHSSCKAWWNLLPLVCYASNENSAAV